MVKRKPPPPRPRGGASEPGGGRRRRPPGDRPGRPRRAPPGAASASAGAPPDGPLWLYGVHAVLAARANPARHLHRLLATAEAARRHAAALDAGPAGPPPEIVARADIEAVLPQGAVHQGLAALATPLPARDLEAVLARCRAADSEARPGARPVLVALDQVTDPQNVGAVLRSAAAFGAAAVIVPRHHAAPESGALAKAASGALEHIPLVAVGNLTRALGHLKAAGFWTVGLAGEAAGTLAEIDPGGPLVLVLGAEGGGLRRLTRETCDLLARLPTGGPIASLNVSNAAAIALYEVLGRRA